jgi:hypothetical protein
VRRQVTLLVCGSRDWTDEDQIADVLCDYANEDVRVIHGGARGADRLAERVARVYGYAVQAYPADWEVHGNAAGPIRNRLMLDRNPDRVLAFHKNQSRGTQDTIDEARRRGIPVTVYEESN